MASDHHSASHHTTIDLDQLIKTVDQRVDYYGKTLLAEIQNLRREQIHSNERLERLEQEVLRLRQEIDRRFDKDESEDPREFRDINSQLRDILSEVKSIKR